MILIDAGHGGADPGAVSLTGIKESWIVLEWARELSRHLSLAGMPHMMSRRQDVSVSLLERVARSKNADMVISLHCNSDDARQGTGTEVLHYGPSTRDNAELLAVAVAESLGIRNRGAKACPELYLLKHTRCPAYIIELGFVDRDLRELMDDGKRQRVILAIIEWIGGQNAEEYDSGVVGTIGEWIAGMEGCDDRRGDDRGTGDSDTHAGDGGAVDDGENQAATAEGGLMNKYEIPVAFEGEKGRKKARCPICQKWYGEYLVIDVRNGFIGCRYCAGRKAVDVIRNMIERGVSLGVNGVLRGLDEELAKILKL